MTVATQLGIHSALATFERSPMHDRATLAQSILRRTLDILRWPSLSASTSLSDHRREQTASMTIRSFKLHTRSYS